MNHLHDKIVEKHNFQLAKGINIGKSFVNAIPIYSYMDLFYFAECDTMGAPTPGTWLVFEKNNYSKYTKMAASLLFRLPEEELKKWLSYPSRYKQQ